MKGILKKNVYVLLSLVVPLFLLSCVTEPTKMELPIEKTAPKEKVTSFTENMKQFGLMMEIYKTRPTKMMVKEIVDKTGASVSTGSEIQQNITEIVKSTLNSMGENVIFIEYDPDFVLAMQQTGYSDFGDKLIPDIIVTGAITEFDRGLESWEKGTDLGAEVEFSHVKKALPSQTISAEYSNTAMANKARITVDFNLKDFRTLAGLPGMNVVNSMEVQKAQKKEEVGITLFGPTFGQKGSMRKVQGRHEALRLLVQSGLIQLVGRRAGIPYWRVFGEDAVPDDSVLKSWRREFPRLDDATKITLLQQYLFLHGYDVDINGNLDSKTKSAYSNIMSKLNLSGALSTENFLKIYLSVPIDENTYEKTQLMIAKMEGSSGNSPTVVVSSSNQETPQQPITSGGQQANDFSKAGNLMTQAYSYFKQNDYANAAKLFDESIKAAPTPVAYYFLAISYQSLKNNQKVIASLEEGVQIFNNDFQLWKALGMSYYEVGDEKKAKLVFQTALTIKPNDKQIKFFLDRIK